MEYTKYGCVDCDACEHRSETCLCDISENDETCPLIGEKNVYGLKNIGDDYIAFCKNCNTVVNKYCEYCYTCGEKLK